MKKITAIAITTMVLGGLYCFPQDIDVEKTLSKFIVDDANLKIEMLLARGVIGDADGDGVIIIKDPSYGRLTNVEKKVYETEAYIIENMTKCSSSENSEKCMAGLNFIVGLLFQQAAYGDEGSTKMFVEKATRYYENVLKTFPNNKAALSNLMKLNNAIGENNSTISRLETLAEKYPKDRVGYLIQIGDLHKLNKKLDLACEFYQKAYEEDPFSEKACGAIVELYTVNEFECTPSKDIRELAFDCQEIDLPNYSEELLKKEMLIAFERKDYNKVIESMVLWANVLADNGWLDPRQVGRLYDQLFSIESIDVPETNKVKSALTELQSIFQIESIQDLENTTFWGTNLPEIYISGGWERVTPLSVLLRIFHSKGEKAYFKKKLVDAEVFWTAVLEASIHRDKAFFTVAAADLAQLYNMNPAMDVENKKLDKLVIELFNMKGAAYQERDLRMIRKYHITLGAIFYNKKKWDGNGAANAKFQLKQAVSERFGPIVNPELRKMLGDVHIRIGEKNEAIGAYFLSVSDYLSLDLVKDAEALHSLVIKKYGPRMTPDQTRSFKVIGSVIDWRTKLTDPNNELQKKQIPIFEFLDKVSSAEKQASEVLPKEFVQLQFFKGLADLGSYLSDERRQEKQILYASALMRIDKVKELSSPRDFYRIKNIKTTLEESVEQSGQLEVVQMHKKANLTYNISDSKTGFKTYSIPTLNKEITVPDQLFELNSVLQNYYRSNTTINKAELEFQENKFMVKDKG